MGKYPIIRVAVLQEVSVKKIVITCYRRGKCNFYICDEKAQVKSVIPITWDAIFEYGLVAIDKDVIVTINRSHSAILFYNITTNHVESRNYGIHDYYCFVEVAFKYNTKEIVALAENTKNDTLVLLSCSKAEECKPKELYLGYDGNYRRPSRLFSHPKGQMLLRIGRKVVVI